MDPKRNSEKPLVITLAQQLSFSIPEIQRYIVESVSSDPAIFSRSLQTQFEKLIVDPIIRLNSTRLKSNGSNIYCPPPDTLPCDTLPLPQLSSVQPALIIIDGLDECKDPIARRLILNMLCNAFPQLQGSLKFLVVSRPEYDIQTFFRTATGKRISPIDILPDIRAHQDVYVYLCDQFERIKREHPLHLTFNPNWPTQVAIQKLVEKSSGHFIYASTVIKYIKNAYDRPQKCLDDIINLSKSSVNPYAELDALYLNILSSARVDRSLLVNILSAALICSSVGDPYSTEDRAPRDTAKLDRVVESVLLLQSGDVQLALLDLKSLIGLIEPEQWGEYLSFPELRSEYIHSLPYPDMRHIEFWHKSFADFLFDSTRSKEFHVQSELAHMTVAKGCLRLLDMSGILKSKLFYQKFQCD